MENKKLDMSAGLEKLKEVKPANASAYVEKQLQELAPKIIEKMEQGYTVEQFYETLDTAALEEIGLDKKVFIKKLKTIITKYKKAIAKIAEQEKVKIEPGIKPGVSATSENELV